jgi:hypothetical protein
MGATLAPDMPRFCEVDRRHDAVAELLLDQRLPGRAADQHEFIEAVDQRIGRRPRRAGAAHRHLVEQRLIALAQAERGFRSPHVHRSVEAQYLTDSCTPTCRE